MTHDSKELLAIADDVITSYFDSCGMNNARAGAKNIIAHLEMAGLTIASNLPQDRPQSVTPQQSADAVKQSFCNYCLNAGVER